FAPEIARLNASSLLLSVLVLLTPSAIHFTSEGLPKAIGEKLRLSAICQAYCYNSYCKQEKLAKSGF
ncbi:MAG: hypothetical protein ACKPKF_18460, partial [Microcystis panniformis]